MKKRIIGGVELPANLYPDQNDPPNQNIWRYRRPNGSYKRLHMPLDEAILRAELANAQRQHQSKAQAGDKAYLPYWIERYIRSVKQREPKRATTDRWKNLCWTMRAMGREHESLAMGDVSVKAFRSWWNTNSWSSQTFIRPELGRMFKYFITEEVCSTNPFSKFDYDASLIVREKGEKGRVDMSLDDFDILHETAERMGMIHVSAAMKLSLATTLRQGDILELRWDTHLDDHYLRKVINKSDRAREDSMDARIEIAIKDNECLKEAIWECKRCAFKAWDSAYMISRPVRYPNKVMKTGADCPTFINGNPFRKDFRRVREASGLYSDLPRGKKPAGFHEIRGLAITLLLQDNHPGAVSSLTAHTEESTMMGYVPAKDKPWVNVTVKQNMERLRAARNFRKSDTIH